MREYLDELIKEDENGLLSMKVHGGNYSGYNADSVMYNIGKSYVMTVPAATGGAEARSTTIHAYDTGALFSSAFDEIGKYVSMIKNKSLSSKDMNTLSFLLEGKS
jgi:predicted hydrocarbon binding protein